MMIETSNKAKKLVSYKMVDEKLILNTKSTKWLIKCFMRFGKSSKLRSSSPTQTFKDWGSGSLHLPFLPTTTAGTTSTPTKSMYSSPNQVSRPKGFLNVVGRKRTPPWQVAKLLHRKEREDQNHCETDKVRLRRTRARISDGRGDESKANVDVPQETGGAQEDRIEQWGRFCELFVGQSQQSQELPGDWRKGSRIPKCQMIDDSTMSIERSLSGAFDISLLRLFHVHFLELLSQCQLLFQHYFWLAVLHKSKFTETMSVLLECVKDRFSLLSLMFNLFRSIMSKRL